MEIEASVGTKPQKLGNTSPTHFESLWNNSQQSSSVNEFIMRVSGCKVSRCGQFANVSCVFLFVGEETDIYISKMFGLSGDVYEK